MTSAIWMSRTILILFPAFYLTILQVQGLLPDSGYRAATKPITTNKRHHNIHNSLLTGQSPLSQRAPSCLSTSASSSYSGDENDIFYHEVKEKRAKGLRIKVAKVIDIISDPVKRNELFLSIRSDATIIWESFYKNINADKKSGVFPRGDDFILWKLAIWGFIWFGVHPFISLLIRSLGLASFAVGFYFIIDSIWTLKTNFSPFVSPAADNFLVQHNSYDLVRHPLYGGIFMTCLGHAIAEYNVDKVILTFALAFVLNKAADKEEQLLIVQHQEAYSSYAFKRRKFIPFVI